MKLTRVQVILLALDLSSIYARRQNGRHQDISCSLLRHWFRYPSRISNTCNIKVSSICPKKALVTNLCVHTSIMFILLCLWLMLLRFQTSVLVGTVNAATCCYCGVCSLLPPM